MSIVRALQPGFLGRLALSVFFFAACESSDALEDAGPMSLLDAGDASAPDGAKPNNALDASSACNSPLNPVASGALPGDNGCSCTTPWAQTDYCINGWGLLCYEGSGNRWWTAADGTCSPLRQQSDLVASCSARRGVLVSRGSACPSGFGSLNSSFEPAADGGTRDSCCHPIDVTAQRCSEAGLKVLPAGADSGILDTQCSNGGQLRGFVTDSTQPSLCCS